MDRQTNFDTVNGWLFFSVDEICQLPTCLTRRGIEAFSVALHKITNSAFTFPLLSFFILLFSLSVNREIIWVNNNYHFWLKAFNVAMRFPQWERRLIISCFSVIAFSPCSYFHAIAFIIEAPQEHKFYWKENFTNIYSPA